MTHTNNTLSNLVHRSEGFSLIEVLISLTILAMSMMALMSMQTAALRSSSNNQNILMAQQVADQAIEWVRTLSAESLSAAAVFPVVGASAISGLSSEYHFDNLSNSTALPTDFGTPTFTRFVGYRLRGVQDPNVQHIDRLFVVRILVKDNYKTEHVGTIDRSVMSQCAATVFWLQEGELQSLNILFFVDWKS
jgi:prepilin-type N-terminal cleavage/methylation domain-containing protein